MKRRSRAEWATIVAEYKSSGQSREAFAAALGLKPGTLSWWTAALKAKRGRSRRSLRPVTDEPVTFMPVELPAGQSAAAACVEITVGDFFASELERAVDTLAHGGEFTDRALQEFKGQFAEISARYGIEVVYRKGAPTVAWGDPPRLEVMESGGGLAAHEMVHAVQFALGGVAALSTAAAAEFLRVQGRVPASGDELRTALGTLDRDKQRAAFKLIVDPMEQQAYAIFEKGAFHATGMLGQRAHDVDEYKARLKENMRAFAGAYVSATVPRIEANLDARAYAGVGHLARTHGETLLLSFGTAAAYAELTAFAVGFHPAAVAAVLIPAGYLAYRAWKG